MDYEMIMENLQLYFTTGVRWVFVGLAVVILLHQIIALQDAEPLRKSGLFYSPLTVAKSLTHWENLVGRARGYDIIINLASVSRSHATLIRDSEGGVEI